MDAVTNSIFIQAIPERVFYAWVSLADLNGWWGVEKCHIDPWKGGAYGIAWFVTEAGIKYSNHGVIRIWQPGRRLKVGDWMWFSAERPFMCGMTMDVSMRKKGDGTLLTVMQDGYHDGDSDWQWYHQAVTEAWPRVLQQLKRYLER